MKITVDSGKYLVYSALTMTNTNEAGYSVGTAATGSFVQCATLGEARAEAKDWAQSEPGITVYVWALDENGAVIETVDSYRTNAD